MTILTHVFVGTNDVERARKFYDAVLSALGSKRVMDFETGSGWGKEAPEFLVTIPIDGQPATHANGGTIGFAAPSRKAVQEFHKLALANDGKDISAPSPRPQITPTAYAAYVRDPDDNKICTYCYLPE